MKNGTYQNIMIDKNLFELEKFNLNDIVIYSIIKGFTSNEKICFATNGYFANHIKKSKDTVRKSITKLFEKGFISITINYDYPSNRVLGTTEKIGGAYLKINKGLLKTNIVPLVKTSNNDINNETNINTSTTTGKLKSNEDLIEGICKEKNIDKEVLYNLIEVFSKHIQDTKKIHKDDNDLYSHFKYWLGKYKPKEEVNLEENEGNYLWFMNLFDTISNGRHIRDGETRELFYKHLKNGVTGDDCRKAIQNLYSSSHKNDWHLKNSFKFATPQYLLNHLNRYLNFKI